MRFGNTLKTIRRSIAVMTILGVVVGVVCSVVALTTGTLNQTWPIALMLTLALPGILFIVCLPTLAFSIRIEEGRVKHCFLDRYVLSDYPLADFKSIERWEYPWAAVIYFRRGIMIRFFGAQDLVVIELEEALERAKEGTEKTLAPTRERL